MLCQIKVQKHQPKKSKELFYSVLSQKLKTDMSILVVDQNVQNIALMNNSRLILLNSVCHFKYNWLFLKTDFIKWLPVSQLLNLAPSTKFQV